MPEFAYIARDAKGQRVTGKVAATNEREAVANLSTQSLFPLEVTAEKEGGSFRISLGRRVKGQTLAVAYGQMASLLRAGVPLLRSLNVLQEQSSNETLKKTLADVHARVEDGATLAEAMGRHQDVFGEMAVNMVRAGGEGGFLEDALDRVAQFTEQTEDLKSRTMGALAYPIILAVVGSLIVTGLIVFFVPKFAVMFERLEQRGELPLMTVGLLATSTFLRNWGWVALLVAAAAGVWLRVQLKTESGRRIRDQLKLKLPLLGGIFLSLAVARFCRVLGTLLRNGVPILKSLEISRQAAGNLVLSEAIEKASENISSGQSLAPPLAASGKFPKAVVEMISVAEESNTLDDVLVEISDGLERRTARRLDIAVRLIEPLMLLVMAGIVLVVVIALLLPIIKMSSTI